MSTTAAELFSGEDPARYSPRLEIRRMRAAQLSQPVRPSRSLIICTNPRTGSWMLCTALAQTSVAGYPSEYLIPWDEGDWSALWNVSGYPEFLDAMKLEGTSPNGVFSAKVMWGHIGHLLDRVRGVPRYDSLGPAELLPRSSPIRATSG